MIKLNYWPNKNKANYYSFTTFLFIQPFSFRKLFEKVKYICKKESVTIPKENLQLGTFALYT